MIEIVVLILFSIQISRIVAPKGYSKLKFIILTIFVWFVFQIIGALIGFMVFNDYWLGYITSYAFAFIGYHIIYSYTQKLNSKVNSAFHSTDNEKETETEDRELKTTPDSLKALIIGLLAWAGGWFIYGKGETSLFISQIIQLYVGILMTIIGFISLIVNFLKKR